MGVAVAIETPLYITGSTGFIGSYLLHHFTNANGIDRQALNAHRTWHFEENATIIHTAAKVHQMHLKPQQALAEYREINTELAETMARKMIAEGGKRFIFFSSIMAEKPNESAYGKSKLEAERKLQALFQDHESASCIILRLPLVYGKDCKGNIQTLLEFARKGKTLPIGSATNKRSMIYIGNIASALEKILASEIQPGIKRYTLTDNHDLSSAELYELIFQQIQHRKGTYAFPPLLLRVGGYMGSWVEALSDLQLPINTRIVSRLFDESIYSCKDFCNDYDWTPEFTPEEGVKKVVGE